METCLGNKFDNGCGLAGARRSMNDGELFLFQSEPDGLFLASVQISVEEVKFGIVVEEFGIDFLIGNTQISSIEQEIMQSMETFAFSYSLDSTEKSNQYLRAWN